MRNRRDSLFKRRRNKKRKDNRRLSRPKLPKLESRMKRWRLKRDAEWLCCKKKDLASSQLMTGKKEIRATRAAHTTPTMSMNLRTRDKLTFKT